MRGFILKGFLVAIISLLYCSFSLYAQTNIGQDARQKKSRKGMLALREKLEVADSLRLAMRHAADEGRLLQWGDSLLRSRYQHGDISSDKFKRLLKHLQHIDHRLHQDDSLLAQNNRKVNFDTLYLAKPQERWTIKFRTNLSGAQLETYGKNGPAFPWGCERRLSSHAECGCGLSRTGRCRGAESGKVGGEEQGQ